MVGMDETMLSKIINGYRVANPELRVKIAGVLGSDEEWLFESPTSTPERNDSTGERTNSPWPYPKNTN